MWGMVQEEQEVRLHPQRVPGGLQESELALELRAQLLSATPWAPEVAPPHLPSHSPRTHTVAHTHMYNCTRTRTLTHTQTCFLPLLLTLARTPKLTGDTTPWAAELGNAYMSLDLLHHYKRLLDALLQAGSVAWVRTNTALLDSLLHAVFAAWWRTTRRYGAM